MDRKKIYVGDEWTEKAEQSLKGATAAVFLLSKDALASSPIVNNEWPYIKKRYSECTEFKLIIVRIGDVHVDQAAQILNLNIKDIISIPQGDPLPERPGDGSYDFARKQIASALESS